MQLFNLDAIVLKKKSKKKLTLENIKTTTPSKDAQNVFFNTDNWLKMIPNLMFQKDCSPLCVIA